MSSWLSKEVVTVMDVDTNEHPVHEEVDDTNVQDITVEMGN